MSDQSLEAARQERAADRARKLEQLRRRTEAEYPESWTPSEEDPMLAGVFLRLDQGPTQYGQQDIVIVRTEDGTDRGVWLIHAVLRKQLARVAPRAGELICIRWKGERKGASGKTYHDYRVEIYRDSAPDWNAIAAGPAVDEPPEAAAGEINARSLEHLPQRDHERGRQQNLHTGGGQ